MHQALSKTSAEVKRRTCNSKIPQNTNRTSAELSRIRGSMTELMHHTSFMAHCLAPSQVDLVVARWPSQVCPTASCVVDAHQDVRIALS